MKKVGNIDFHFFPKLWSNSNSRIQLNLSIYSDKGGIFEVQNSKN